MDELKAEIIKLGGDEADFELVKDVHDPEDEEWRPNKHGGKETQPDDTFDIDEFKQFYASLNFSAVKHTEEELDEESPKQGKRDPKTGPQTGVKSDPERVVKPAPKPVVVKPPPPPAPKIEEVPSAEVDAASVKLNRINIKLRQKPILKFGEDEDTWYESLDYLYSQANVVEKFRGLQPMDPMVKELKDRAVKLLAHESSFHEQITRKFVNTAAESGTARDKV